MEQDFDALLVVAFGGPDGPDDVMPFLQNAVRGRGVPRHRLEEVAEHYRLLGGVSPINAQSRALVEAIQVKLDGEGPRLPVYLGNRNWHPFLAETLERMRADGVAHALALFTSPYSSYSSCRQYLEDIERARDEVGAGSPRVSRLRQYFNHPGFIDTAAELARQALESMDPAAAERAEIVFTAHSIPLAMSRACDYWCQLQETSSLVAERVAPGRPWELVWQSRSGPPQVPWLEPQIGTHLEAMRARGTESAILIPIGFISDHVEVVFDLDNEAAEVARRLGINMTRSPTVGVHEGFIEMVRELVRERTEGAPARALGVLGVRPWDCAVGCCPLLSERPA